LIGVALLGSTGSIGRSALEVVARHPDRFRVVALAANRRVDELARQAARFRPEVVAVADPDTWTRATDRGASTPGSGRWTGGREAVLALARRPDVDVVLNALVGAAGLEVTLAALEAGKRLALANKESLVAGGPLVLDAASRGGGSLVPVDSEHSAILQCLHGCGARSISRLVLTASGGPFRGWNLQRLDDVRPVDALRHPTWDMGAKITVDSATLANKALEVIEAHFIFQVPYDAIDVVVHPQSIVHSFVEFVDGSVLAQVGVPTMELPILYALSHPERLPDPALCTFDPVRASPLTFEEVDRGAFPLFGLGVEAGRKGGVAPAVFNAGNEVAVAAFLRERIRFREMEEVVAEAIAAVGPAEIRGIGDVLEADRAAREAAGDAVARLSKVETRRAT
jgi:1-deoxy-D-xylulose-5-phosphate reductoisomerase